MIPISQKKKKEYIVEYLRKNLTHSHFHTIIIFSVEISHNITHTRKIVILKLTMILCLLSTTPTKNNILNIFFCIGFIHV